MADTIEDPGDRGSGIRSRLRERIEKERCSGQRGTYPVALGPGCRWLYGRRWPGANRFRLPYV